VFVQITGHVRHKCFVDQTTQDYVVLFSHLIIIVMLGWYTHSLKLIVFHEYSYVWSVENEVFMLLNPWRQLEDFVAMFRV